MTTIYSPLSTPIPLQQTRVDVFESIFLVFLGLGTLVGVVVVAYTLYNAYKYRDAGDTTPDESLPTLGELPTGGKGGKKLFLSFGISAIIVISLVIWTYGMLLYVEDPQDEFEEDPIEIEVVGDSFSWSFEYENGVDQTATMTVPADHPVAIRVTSGDVWHTFGVTDLRVKADAIPGEYDETWFVAEEAGEEHGIECYELCGDAHTNMIGTVDVMEEDQFEEWLDDQLRLEVTIETDAEEPEPVTEGYEMRLEHTEEDFEYEFTADDFDNGTITVNEELEQGGEYDLTITFEDDDIETIEETIEITGPTSETFAIEVPGTADDDDDDDGDDEGDNDDEEDNDGTGDGGEDA